MKTFDEMSPRTALIEIARDFHARGWMPGTAGNLSVREGDASFLITASSRAKGRLDETDFVRIALQNGELLERFESDAKPSAETSIHLAIYRALPYARACLHVHSIDACLVTDTMSNDADQLSLPPVEMLKGLGIWDENPNVTIPVFSNVAQVSVIAQNIAARFATKLPDVPALLIRGHGITCWGKNLQEAYNQIESAEFLMSYIARSRGRNSLPRPLHLKCDTVIT